MKITQVGSPEKNTFWSIDKNAQQQEASAPPDYSSEFSQIYLGGLVGCPNEILNQSNFVV